MSNTSPGLGSTFAGSGWLLSTSRAYGRSDWSSAGPGDINVGDPRRPGGHHDLRHEFLLPGSIDDYTDDVGDINVECEIFRVGDVLGDDDSVR